MAITSLLRAIVATLAGLATLPGSSSAELLARLYAASNDGIVTTLELKNNTIISSSTASRAANATLPSISLDVAGLSQACGRSPSWLTLDSRNAKLYCINEGTHDPMLNGTLKVFDMLSNGNLSARGSVSVPGLPTHAELFNMSSSKGLAVTSYNGMFCHFFEGSDLTSFFSYNTAPLFSKPGPFPDGRQNSSHPCQTLIDPTGEFFLIPDLGSDKIALVPYYQANNTMDADPFNPYINLDPGCGPRHGAFLRTETNRTFFYLTCELSDAIYSMELEYDAVSKILSIPILQKIYIDKSEGAWGAAEIHISPDNRFLIVSNRIHGNWSMSNPDPDTRGTRPTINTDTIVTYKIGEDKPWELTYVQTAWPGGHGPRHFSINKAGTLVAVGLEDNPQGVAVFERNVTSGEINKDTALAFWKASGGVTCVIFDDGTTSIH